MMLNSPYVKYPHRQGPAEGVVPVLIPMK